MNMLCSRCKQRVAVVFVSKIENGQPVNEGYCLQCARELGIPQVQEMIDKLGISVRTGQHCAEPVMTHYGVTGMCRASFAMYNTLAEADALVAGVERAVKMLK